MRWAVKICLKLFEMEINSVEPLVAFIERRLLLIVRAVSDIVSVLLIRDNSGL
jgi:hypothetical protein